MDPSDLQGDLLQPRPEPAARPGLEQLQAQYQSLRSTLVAMLIALVLLSFGVILFIGKQMTTVHARLDAFRPEAYPLTSDFQKRYEPLMRNFLSSLQWFAVTNRDYQPILDKYRTALYPYFPPVSPAPAAVPPAPVQKPAPK